MHVGVGPASGVPVLVGVVWVAIYLSPEGLVGCMQALYCSILLFVISVGSVWVAQSMLEWMAAKKNFSIMSDMARVFWTVCFRMISLVFLFLTPSNSSLSRNWLVCRDPRTPTVKLVWETFHPFFSLLHR